MNSLSKKFQSVMFSRYSIVFQITIILIGIHAGGTYYESHIMKVSEETKWINSPNGIFKAKATVRSKGLHKFVKLKVLSKKDTIDWFEVMNAKLVTLPFFEKKHPFLQLRWKDGNILQLGYYKKYSVTVPFEILHENYFEVIIK